jgi:diadenosine tetraphosphatase ApaH/serine/threonine PP2A family protein phosphatase
MQVAIVSDIHGNRHAFEAVLEEIAATDARELWCMGDVVGYGADPNRCCELVREHAAVVLAGNHDLAVTGELPLDEFSHGAALAARWTQDIIEDDHLEWLRSLRPRGAENGIGLYHASPRDPVWEYVLSTLLAELCFDAAPERVCVVGHSHVALSFVRPDGEAATGEARRAGEALELSAGEWLINPGSVGQPRDGDPRAAWLLLDTGTWRAEWRRTDYDIGAAAAAIRGARLPDSLAERLEYGQ